MAGAGFVILFVAALAGCAIWSVIYLTFVAHYLLTTITDSSAGNDEVHYPSEAVAEWWWKPVFCLWIAGVFLIPASLMLAPLLAIQPLIYVICLAVLLWVLYPIGLLSALYTQNWLYFLHPRIIGRMLRHYGALAYVHLMTMLAAVCCVGVLIGAFTHTFLWALPAAFLVPTTILFYARNWGRFAWLSLNFLSRTKKTRRPWRDILAEEAQANRPTSEAIRPGLPPTPGHAFQTGTPDAESQTIKAGPVPKAKTQEPEEDEWAADKKPYQVDDAALPTFLEAIPAPTVHMQTAAGAVPEPEEEEDEWALNKKPYKCEDPTHPASPDPMLELKPKADRPVVLSEYYDDRALKEKLAEAKKAAEMRMMPAPSKKTPTFRAALLFGVWEFMLYSKTLHVWANLVVLTIVELLFLVMMAKFWPRG